MGNFELTVSSCDFWINAYNCHCPIRNSQRLIRNSIDLSFRNSNSKFAILMVKSELEKRTRVFALRIIGFVAALPKNKVSDVTGYQLLKAGTSIGANYREANRAESRNDFIHKIAIVEKEAAETQYWLELCSDAEIGDPKQRRSRLQESAELLAIFTRIGRTAKANK